MSSEQTNTERDELAEWNSKRAMKYSDDAAEAWRSSTSGTYARTLEDLSAKHSATADLIESQQQRIRDLEAELKAAYASETYEQRRAEQAEATIARVRKEHANCEPCPTIAILDASPEEGGQS